jgi:hypothetical protein
LGNNPQSEASHEIAFEKSRAQLSQSVSEENDKGVVELVESQNYEHECNHHQGEDGLPAQHDDRFKKLLQLQHPG